MNVKNTYREDRKERLHLLAVEGKKYAIRDDKYANWEFLSLSLSLEGSWREVVSR